MKIFRENLFQTRLSLAKKSTVAILCTILVGLFVAHSCEKRTNMEIPPNENSETEPEEIVIQDSCAFENPLTDLLWLKEIVDEIPSDNGDITIHQCNYRDGIGFLLNWCVNCSDQSWKLMSCKGESLCGIGGFATLSCPEYKVDMLNATLIWVHNSSDSCVFEDPFELPWLESEVLRLSHLDPSVNVSPLSVSIYQCIYGNGKTGFLIDNGNSSPFYSCNGKLLCMMGGITNEECSHLNIVSKELIWQINL
ncbi:MAG: hypothetical protein FWH36_03990 [Lentimicrobiaceae bacterium]|nr:hypothetical protein [Lentimicrobiaceae bacterium]